MTQSLGIFRYTAATALFTAAIASAQAGQTYDAEQQAALAPVNALFDAMVKHDVEASRKLILPGAAFVVVKPDGTVSMEHDVDYLDSLAKHKEGLRERIWNVQVTVNDNIAQVWAPYDFHLDGKLTHCGIDVFSMVRTSNGWRIAGISYSTQKTGCKPSPLDKS
jgi:hypothetical protein